MSRCCTDTQIFIIKFRLTLFLGRGGLLFLGVTAPHSLFIKPECSSGHTS